MRFAYTFIVELDSKCHIEAAIHAEPIIITRTEQVLSSSNVNNSPIPMLYQITT